MRVTWVQPEDVLPHELRQAAAEGNDVTAIAERWRRAGGAAEPPYGGASKPPASDELRALARRLLAELGEFAGAESADEPNVWAAIRATWPAESSDRYSVPFGTQSHSVPSTTGGGADPLERPGTESRSVPGTAGGGADPLERPGTESRVVPGATGGGADPLERPGTESRVVPGATGGGGGLGGDGTESRLVPSTTSDAGLLNRLHGGWLGRAAGCLLGKPVERTPREGIREILEATGRYPLDSYFTAVGLPDDVSAKWPWNRASRPTSLVENIDGMPEDDDTNYTLLALHILETYGRDFTADDVAQTWLLELPAGRVFTAERAAYRNLLDGYDPPETATRGNPFREWIGALIRTDLYGWINPGDVATAAEMAWRDARVSHTRNGLYGAMFVAAMTAAACVTDDVSTVLDAGLSVVPPRSRLALALRQARELGRSGLDLDRGLDRLHDAFQGMHWVHVLNNAALVAYALEYGKGDFATSICATVTAGWDTDSAGATVGAITGTLAGAKALPSKWIAPLKNRIASSITSFDGIGFDELAERTVRHVSR